MVPNFNTEDGLCDAFTVQILQYMLGSFSHLPTVWDNQVNKLNNGQKGKGRYWTGSDTLSLEKRSKTMLPGQHIYTCGKSYDYYMKQEL